MKRYTTSHYGKVNSIILFLLFLCMSKIGFGEHVVPNKCGVALRAQYNECIEAIKWCGVEAGLCTNVVAWITGICVIPSAGCGIQTLVCLHKLDNYQHCCNHLKADPITGFTRQMLWNAAKCNTCTSKNDAMKSVCNAPDPNKKKDKAR